MQQTLTPMISQIGHINPDGDTDFLSRSANGRITPRGWTQGRDVTVDTVDHRLVMSDNYSHRVMVFELDRMNRLLERGATWVFGQEDPASAVLMPGRDATTIKLPLAVEYDESHKRLFVTDGSNHLVLVFDVHPDRMQNLPEAISVIGEPDFDYARSGPGDVFVHESPSTAQPLLTGRGIVTALEGVAPESFAVATSSRRDGSLRSAHTVTSHQEGTLFWAPVDTYPDVLHHGDIDAELSIVNEGLVHATLFLELFDIDGGSTAMYERTVPLGERAQLSLEEVFGRSPIRGTLRAFADTAVTLSLQESTVTINDEMIVADVPLQATRKAASDEIVLPVFHNGGGQATEIVLINTDRQGYDGELSVMSSQGELRTMILR